MEFRGYLPTLTIFRYALASFLLYVTAVSSSFAQAPTTGATNLTITNQQGDRVTVGWTRGNGGNVLVVASTSSTFNGTGIPADGTDYNVATVLGTGDPVGTGNFGVYRSTGTAVTVSGLSHSTTYYFRVYEFNGATFTTQYNTTNVLAGSGTTLLPPTVSSSNLVATPTGNTAALTWTRGNGSRSLVILQAGTATSNPTQYVNYSASLNFGSGTAIGTGRVVYFNNANSITVTNLQPNTQYFYRVVEGNGATAPVFDIPGALVGSFTTLGAPTVGSSGFSISNSQGNAVSLNFTKGNGTQRLIVARQDNPVIFTPTDGVDYNTSSNFGSGDNLGNNTFAIGEGTITGITLSGLTPATTYHFAIFEFNGSATNTFYLTAAASVLVGPGTTLSPPSNSAGSLSFTNITGYNATVNFTAGNGAARIILVKASTPVTDIPVNLVNYLASQNYPAAPALGASKIVYEGGGLTFNLQSLQPNTTYHFAIFEFNGTTGPVYKQADPATGSFTTLGKPTVSPTTLTFSGAQGDRVTANFTSGNGFGRIVIVKQGAPVDMFPTDFTSYTANPIFGTAAAHLGNGNYVVQNNGNIGGNTSTNVTGLAIGQSYHFAIIEYNGTTTERIYMTSAQALTGIGTTLSAPTVQPSSLAFSNITSNTLTISWANGNGDGRMVLIRQAQAVQDFPTNLVIYNSSTNYGTNYLIGTSKVLYDGPGSTINITNIPPGTYHVAIVEFNGFGQPVYQLVNPLIGTVNVGDKPPTPAANLLYSIVQGNSMQLSFTRGDGLSRMIVAKAGSAVDAWPMDFNGYTAGVFGAGSDLGGGNFVVASGTSNIYTVNGLQPSSLYHFAIVEFNGTGASAYYQLPSIVLTGSNSTLSAPTVTTSSFFANNVTGNKLQLTWTKGSGTGRFIVAKANSAADYVPTNLTDPASSSSFGSSANLGTGNYGVYDGTDDNFILTNLEPATTYHFASYEYNGINLGKVYLTSSVGRASFTTAARPSVAPKNPILSAINGDRLTVQFTIGNGTRRMIVLRKGGLVNELPTDLTTYTGGAFGVGTLIANGNYVTTVTTGNSAIITGLEPNTQYGLAVFEMDGSNGNERYMITEYINQVIKTSSPPTILTNSILYNSLGNTSVNLSWTNGNGEARMVVLTPYQPVTFVPTVLNAHGTASSNNASTANNLPNAHKHIYRGNATTVTITNLLPGTTYHLGIYEYNGLGQPVYAAAPLRGYFTTLPTSGIAIGGFDAITFCPLQQVDVPYVFTGLLNAGNQMSVELSDITGSFAAPTLLGVQSTTNATGFITSTLPASLTEGIGYRLRVVATSPASTSADNGANLQIATSVQPTFTVVGGQTTTCGIPIQLSTSQPGYNVQWFRDSQPIPFATASNYIARQTGSYQVRIAGASGGCQLLSPATVLTITQPPAFNLTIAPQYCINSVIDLTPLANPPGGTLSGPGVSNGVLTGSVAGIGQHLITYTYVDAVSLCSYSEITSVKVGALPSAPLVTPAIGCQLADITLTASGADVLDSYAWYTVPTGGTPIVGQTTATFVATGLNTTTSYYVAIVSAFGCEGPRTEVIATVTPGPTAPTIPTPATSCGSGTVTITAAGAANGQYRWYDVATGGTAIAGATNAAFTTPSISTTTNYFVSISNGTCESARTMATASIINCSNQPPVITTSAYSVQVGGKITINLANIISDPDGNLDAASFKIITQPSSGAIATIDGSGVLTIDYNGLAFSGAESLTIEACDALDICSQEELTIEVSSNLVIYNAVSPNGDNKNDFLFLQYIDALESTKNNKVSIFNRWGDLVIEIKNYDNKTNIFKGLNKNGNEVSSGTYYYKIEFGGGTPSRSGYLSLKR